MSRISKAAIISALACALAGTAIALGASTLHFITAGHSHEVRAVQIGGVWYASVDDIAHALGGGASFDASKRTLYASAGDRYSQLHYVDRVGGGFATDGTIAVRVVSVKKSMSFQGNAPDPGAHFVFATMQLKNLTSAPVAMYDVQTSMVKGSDHINDGQFYNTAGHDLNQTDVSPGQTVTYMCVFEIDDDVAADGILVHPPFAPTTRPVDMVLKL
ncbi:MAG TPA: DUF4352 domain-containing protein [Candidatus Eremiobacteraceae bacterium]|nr:DUF4352 domain-containing protein [Candidatus Eremiobacteraceae bacterium]